MKRIIAAIASVSLLVIGLTPFLAADAEVTATVTLQQVSVEVTAGGSQAYGNQPLGELDVVATPGSFTVRNNGNVVENFDIRGVDTAWTLVGTVPGDEEYRHRFKIGAFTGSGDGTALDTTGKSLTTSVAVLGTAVVNLQLDMPSSTATLTEQSPNVTVIASAS